MEGPSLGTSLGPKTFKEEKEVGIYKSDCTSPSLNPLEKREYMYKVVHRSLQTTEQRYNTNLLEKQSLLFIDQCFLSFF